MNRLPDGGQVLGLGRLAVVRVAVSVVLVIIQLADGAAASVREHRGMTDEEALALIRDRMRELGSPLAGFSDEELRRSIVAIWRSEASDSELLERAAQMFSSSTLARGSAGNERTIRRDGGDAASA